MARDNEHKTYKEKWACFRCRKCFKQRNWLERLDSKLLRLGKARIVPCPQCHAPMHNMGWDFKVPKQSDVEQWKKAEVLAGHNIVFQSYCYWNEPHQGPGPRPARLRDVQAFIEAESRKSTKSRPLN